MVGLIAFCGWCRASSLQDEVPLLRLRYMTASGNDLFTRDGKPHDILVSPKCEPQYCFTCNAASCKVWSKNVPCDFFLTEASSQENEPMETVLPFVSLLKARPRGSKHGLQFFALLGRTVLTFRKCLFPRRTLVDTSKLSRKATTMCSKAFESMPQHFVVSDDGAQNIAVVEKGVIDVVELKACLAQSVATTFPKWPLGVPLKKPFLPHKHVKPSDKVTFAVPVPKVIKTYLKRHPIKKEADKVCELLKSKLEDVEGSKSSAHWFAVDCSAIKALGGKLIATEKMDLKHTALVYWDGTKARVRSVAPAEILELKGWPSPCLNMCLLGGVLANSTFKMSEPKFLAIAAKTLCS